ncbi:TrkH family potassium uptake protein [Bogoriella caseilytica]|uniref:Potassium uptake TrkH family protein n=1 Tax=Bogoriella caseilytica TaxID=56055 RepID=A0A3N2BC17_9MICO|nr:potassium transporter TrkG [Bogoriella caseilytica]ROR72790.1 potassium uptake TrkH family protein [Bogoriella caseilytica]
MLRAPHRNIRHRLSPPRLGWKERDRHGIDPRRPVQVVVLAFAISIAAGTSLLLLPMASTDGTTVLQAFFTAVSAICVTGLIVVDTPTHWSVFGQVVIMALIQVGGFGVMTLASVLTLAVSRQLGLHSRLVTTASTRGVQLGEIRGVLVRVFWTTVAVELAVTAILALRWSLGYGETPGRALWLGLFHSISAFNNAGFALFSDSLMPFTADGWIVLPIAGAFLLGGLGFPVLIELYRQHRRPRRWSPQTKLTLLATAVLIPAGTAFVLATEWANPATLGPMNVAEKTLAAFFQGVTPRTAGFNSLEIGEMNTGTWLGMDVLMLIGGGSGGTAGGIKMATVALLGFVIWSELRGDQDVTVFRRRASARNIREAVTVALLAIGAVAGSTLVVALSSPFSLDEILFEVVSAFATVGLSTGITAELSGPHQLLLCALMFLGRLGPITLGTALAMRERKQAFRYPETTMVIG